MSKYTTCKKCGGKRHRQSRSCLCYKCWLEKVRKDSPYISGEKVSGGSQYKRYGKTHYERNKQTYIDRANRQKKTARARIIAYKKRLSCVDCGICDYRIIDFDHKPGTKNGKRTEVMALVSRGCSWNRILEEIKKCEPRCSNCHRIKTWERRQASIG